MEAAKGGLRALLTHDDIGGRYARNVLTRFFAYTASLVPEIADDILAVDRAMKWGYNWKYGPFELIDRLGDSDTAGPKWLADTLRADGKPVPALLEAAGDQPFYKTEDKARQYFTTANNYEKIVPREGAWMLADIKLTSTPLKKNGSCALWDIGEGIACLEFTSKMNSIDPDIIQMMKDVVTYLPENGYRGLVIGNDGDNFSVGANLGFVMYGINIGAWDLLEEVIKSGQDAVMGLKYAPFPVVAATSGFCFGGGCEIPLHCDAIQASMETYIGLVEVGVGIIPGWGGCKEMIVRNLKAGEGGGMLGGGSMAAVKHAFETIMLARVAESAQLARDTLVMNAKSRITMNRERLLADARELCLSLADGYTPPEPATLKLPGASARAAIGMTVKGFKMAGKASDHDEIIAKELARVLTGGDADSTDELTEQDILDLEMRSFMKLLREPKTHARIEHMLETNKPLRN